MSERQKKRLAQKEANRLKRRMIEKVLSNSKSSNVAFNLNLLVDGWLELESDPATFSLLIEDFGCYGAQVDEVYDLEQKFDTPVFGFIFLFKWLNNQQNERPRNQKSTLNSSNINDKDKDPPSEQQTHWSYVEDQNIISEMFFAKQMISNSCATHALISILLNCDHDELNLGPTLSRLKEHTKVMDPESKGYAIGNLPELAKAHNSHASYSSLYTRDRQASHNSAGMSFMVSGNQRTNLQQQKNREAYHFVSYVPINNRLYELDGLKNNPIDHGPINPKEDWTEKFKTVIKQRLFADKTGDDMTASTDIRYNLMAVVPDRRINLRAQLRKLKNHAKLIDDSIVKMTKRVFTPLTVDIDIPNPPYSPLSNGTLTASEAGSAHNSPRHFNDCFLPDDDNSKVERFFFIKFDQNANLTNHREENSESAHKNCIVQLKPSVVDPLNFTREALNKDSEKQNGLTSKEDGDSGLEIKDSKQIEQDDPKPKPDVSDDRPMEVPENHESSNEDKSNQNGSDCKEPIVNETRAHKNEKYNLSSEPPFDFNILNDMQHVHIEKSTLKDLMALSGRLSKEMSKVEAALKEENDKRRKFKIDNSRKTHNYEPFIMTFLSMLARQGNLADLIEKDLGIISEESPSNQNADSTPKTTSTHQPAVKSTRTPISANGNKLPTSNGVTSQTKNGSTTKTAGPIKPKYKYVSTGRPVGRPRKNPLVPSPVKSPNLSKNCNDNNK